MATMGGKVFAVWPEEMVVERVAAAPSPASLSAPRPTPAPKQPAAAPTGNGHIVRAPIPGVINKIAVQVGDVVAIGQELCVVEAMKMNNVIRTTRAGTIKTIPVTTGQHVWHGDVLIELED